MPERLPWAPRHLGTALVFSAAPLWGGREEGSPCRALLGLAQPVVIEDVLHTRATRRTPVVQGETAQRTREKAWGMVHGRELQKLLEQWTVSLSELMQRAIIECLLYASIGDSINKPDPLLPSHS